MFFTVCLDDEKPVFVSDCHKATLQYTDENPYYKIQQWSKTGKLRGEFINHGVPRGYHIKKDTKPKNVR
jgi:hypothetical protein